MDSHRSLLDRSILKKPASASFQFSATPVCVANLVLPISKITMGFNSQLQRYLQTCNSEQEILLQKTNQHINQVYADTPNPTTTLLRDRTTWSSVKRLVVREELMKGQITGKMDLPISDIDKQKILDFIKNKDLSKLDDTTINNLIEKIKGPNDQQFMDALKRFKDTGQATELLQQSKLPELSKELSKIDFKHITSKQYDHLLENYCERTEFHHRESISSNPNKQSLTDNVEAVKTSDHDAKHTDPETGKIDYRKPLNEAPLDRKNEMKQGNNRRVLKNELKGLGLAAAIGFGVGFTMSFLAEIAKRGIVSEEMGDIVFNSLLAGTEISMVATVTYGSGRLLTAAIKEVGVEVTTKFGTVLNSAAVGILSTAIVCVYQYVKLRISGADVDEAFSAIRKTAITSLSLLVISIFAKSICGGPAGIIVSTSVGVLCFSTNFYKTAHAKNLELRLREYFIEEYRSLLDKRKLIYIS